MFRSKLYDQANSALLEDLLEVAGEQKEQPSLPPSGIPKRWLPGFVRILLKCLVLPYVLIDNCMQKLARKLIRPPFRKVGKCNRRGNCCYYILIPYSKTLWGRLFFLWHTQVHGFYMRHQKPHFYEGKQVLVMGCRYLKKNGSCGQYSLRPQVCRQWPLIEYFGYPKILKGCGYTSIPPSPYAEEKSKDVFEGDPRLKLID